MARVVHFDISADNIERAIGFYERVFGWTFEKWEGPMDYWLITTGPDGEPGINGGLSKRGDMGEGVIHTIQVDSLDPVLEQVVEAGGTVARPKMAIPGVGYMAYIEDTEGTVFGLMEEDTDAK